MLKKNDKTVFPFPGEIIDITVAYLGPYRISLMELFRKND